MSIDANVSHIRFTDSWKWNAQQHRSEFYIFSVGWPKVMRSVQNVNLHNFQIRSTHTHSSILRPLQSPRRTNNSLIFIVSSNGLITRYTIMCVTLFGIYRIERCVRVVFGERPGMHQTSKKGRTHATIGVQCSITSKCKYQMHVMRDCVSHKLIFVGQVTTGTWGGV